MPHAPQRDSKPSCPLRHAGRRNDSPFGLGAAGFAQDLEAAARVPDQLEVRMVGLNTTINSAPDMPFGGVKSSGIGRELGQFGMDEFGNKKLVRIV